MACLISSATRSQRSANRSAITYSVAPARIPRLATASFPLLVT
jgi:hypothetical protein